MTVPVADQLEYISDADGVTKDFPYPKRFLQKDEVVVALRNADGIDTPQILGTHYTISGSSWPTGGTVSFITAPQAPNKVVRYRMTQAKQTVGLANNQRNDAPSVELQLDRLTMGLQDRGARGDLTWLGLVAEIAARKAGDAALNLRVTQETQNRIAADTLERDARIAGDSALGNGLNDERLQRIAGDRSVASLIGQAGPIEVPFYDTLTAASLANIKPTVGSVVVGGTSSPGDGGRALYVIQDEEPPHPGKKQMSDGRWLVLSERVVNYAMFGADLTGAVPADLSMSACHEYANLTGARVEQKWGTVLWRQIPSVVKTDCDLAGLTIICDAQSGVPGLVYASPTIYQVRSYLPEIDFTTQEISNLQNYSTAKLSKGSSFNDFPRFLENPYSLIRLESSNIEGKRNGTVDVPLKEYVVVGQNGILSEPFRKSMTTNLTRVVLYPREDSCLVMKLPKVNLMGALSLRIVHVRRNMVTLDGLVVHEPSPENTSVKSLINAQYCWDLTVKNFYATNPSLALTGAYGILLEGCVGVQFERVTGFGFGTPFGSNWIKNFRAVDCTMGRFDVHWSGYDFHLEHCTITTRGVSITGGGFFTARNCKHVLPVDAAVSGDQLHNYFFMPKSDYGYYFDGTVDICNLEVVVGRSVTYAGLNSYSVVRLGGKLDYDWGGNTFAPQEISIKNVKLSLPSNFTIAANTYFNLIGVDLSDASFADSLPYTWTYPKSIVVDTVGYATTLSAAQRCITRGVSGNNYAHNSVRIDTSAVTTGDVSVDEATNCSIIIRNIRSSLHDRYRPAAQYGEVRLSHEVSTWGDGYGNMNRYHPLIQVHDCPDTFVYASVRGELKLTSCTVRGIRTSSPAEDISVVLLGCTIRPMSAQMGTGSYTFTQYQFNYIGCSFYKPVNAVGAFDTAVSLGLAKGIGNVLYGGAISGEHYTNVPAGFFLT